MPFEYFDKPRFCEKLRTQPSFICAICTRAEDQETPTDPQPLAYALGVARIEHMSLTYPPKYFQGEKG